jgi:FKBP-type peptidyl-prolyl cis-trans isomerase
MFRILSVVASAAMLVNSAAAQEAAPAPAAAAPQFKTLAEKVSYMVGLNIGRQLKQDGMDVDHELLVRGLRDALSGAKAAMTDEEMSAAVREFSKQQMAKEAAEALAANPELKALADKNSAEGAAFLAENGKKEGVVTLPSGLQYKVLTAGNGPTPKAADTVQTHYSGKLLDGTVFDSSYERGQPASFGVDQVIAGWTEALQKMKAGDKWEVYIPGDLAYGLRGSPPKIGPNSTLIFTVELIAVEPALPVPQPN